MSDPAVRILVATDIVADGQLVRRLLADEFNAISLSTVPDRSVQDFEEVRPDVLVLAFNSLEKAERYYLGLYRLSELIHALPHRTVILCTKDDVRRVYELCKKEYFDDYILFWPMAHDASRLPMTVLHAVRQVEAQRAQQVGPHEFAVQARRIAELEAQLAQSTVRGVQRVDRASRSLRQVGRDIGDALDGFTRRLREGELLGLVQAADHQGLERELVRLQREQIEPRLRQAVDTVQPVRQWVGSLQEELAPQLESARALGTLADKVRPVILVVEDDELQVQAIARILSDAGMEPLAAASGSAALGALRKHRPDLVLMDLELPDIDGIEVTRRMKAAEAFAAIPVIMLTGHSARERVVDSRRAGAVDFVVKPFDRDTMLGKVRRLLAGG